jgi:HEAT repeat protein
MLSRRKRITICTLAAVVAAIAGVVLRSPSQPTCDGHTITHWIAVLDSRDADQKAHAFAAIEKIGTNALPTILHLLGTRDSGLKFRIRGLVERVPLLHLRFASAADVRLKAWMALAISGQESIRASIPELAGLLRDPDPGVRLRAVEMLSVLPFNDTAPLPALEAAQNDPAPQVRATAGQSVQSRRAVNRVVQQARGQ